MHAQQAGRAAVVIIDSEERELSPPGLGEPGKMVPVVMITKRDGEQLLQLLSQDLTATMSIIMKRNEVKIMEEGLSARPFNASGGGTVACIAPTLLNSEPAAAISGQLVVGRMLPGVLHSHDTYNSLGSQMFVVAAACAYALRLGRPCVFEQAPSEELL